MSTEPPRTRTILTKALARVEGEGAMHVRIADGEVEDVQLRIYEPPRFFEALLRGRRHTEPPDITARICGICPVAYQMSACAAVEDACGLAIDGPIRELRRLIYCGEWIESHTLHVFMLHAPDFLGYESAIEMARDHREVVELGLRMKKIGNELIRVVGGREIHPINVRLGGFWRAPTARELAPVAERLKEGRELASEAVRWVGALDFPEYEEDYEFVALTEPDRYAIEGGRVRSTQGLDIAPVEYEEHFAEEQVPHSTALHSRLIERGSYLVGPLARYALSSDLLPAGRPRGRDRGWLGRGLPQSLPQHRGTCGGGALRVRRGDPDHRGLRAARSPCRRGTTQGRAADAGGRRRPAACFGTGTRSTVRE